jgi:RNA polymerase sigma factor (sigma-70 family)
MWMEMTDDCQLLRQYAREHSEAAFGELVRGHIDLVYATALRALNGDTHLAEDVTQTVFIDLARKAGNLPAGVTLPGWLYRHTCFTASKAARTERRRQTREQTAVQMSTVHAESNWEQIGPLLDDALLHLSDADRDAIVLRFLNQEDFRAVGAALGISDDAAQKRVSRALEKLRDILSAGSPVGAKLSVAALVSGLGVCAATAAPSALAGSVTTASLAAVAAFGPAAGLAALKFTAMTKLQVAIAGVLVIATVATPLVLQHQSLKQVRQENLVLRRQTAELARSGTAVEPVAGLPVGADQTEDVQREHRELLALRNEVRQLREQVVSLRAGRLGNAPQKQTGTIQEQVQEAASPVEPTNETARQLGIAASRGDVSAFDQLIAWATAASKMDRTNQSVIHKDIRTAFDVMVDEAAKGNELALEALWRGTHINELQGFGTLALGRAAGLGVERALEPLLTPEKFGIARDTALIALQPAADSGNPKAIEKLVAGVSDPNQRGILQGLGLALRQAALAGNATAIDGLALIAASNNKAARDNALRTLKDAALTRHHPKAMEALNHLGF